MKKYVRLFYCGYFKIRMEGVSIERFWNLCAHKQIKIWDFKKAKNKSQYECYIARQDFDVLSDNAYITNTNIIIVKEYGIPFFIKKFRKKKKLLVGIFLLCFIPGILSRYLWSIEITGNCFYSEQSITEQLKEHRISIGSNLKEIDCNDINEFIREQNHDIIWISTHIKGSRLYIRMKENPDMQEMNDSDSDNSSKTKADSLLSEKQVNGVGKDMIASHSGTIESIITRKGIPLVHKGDQVKQNQILVLGRVDQIGDNGEIEDVKYVDADADIWISYQYDYKDRINVKYSSMSIMPTKKEWYVVRLGTFCVQIGSGTKTFTPYYIQSHFYGKKYRVGKMKLPVYFYKNYMQHYQWETKIYSKNHMKMKLNQKFKQFHREMSKKGVVITANNVKILISTQFAKAEGVLVLKEKVNSFKQTEKMVLKKEIDFGYFRNNH